MKRSCLLILFLTVLFIPKAQSGISSSKDSLQTLIKSFKYNQALEYIDHLLVMDSSCKDLYAAKGFALRELYDYEHAVKAYLQALMLDSTNSSLIIEVANTYKLSEDYPHSLAYFSKALEKDTANLFLQLECANCKLLNNQFDDAINDFMRLYIKDSTNSYVIKCLAFSFSKLLQTEVAIFFYQKAIEINPTDVSSVLGLTNLFTKTKAYKEGIKRTEQYRAIDPSNENVNSMNAFLYLSDKQYDLAIERYLKCIEAGDSSEFILKNIGIAYYSKEEYDMAKGFFEKAYGIDPTNASTVHFLGVSCYRSFYKELGILYLEKAMELYQPSLDKLAMVYRNYAEACQGWDKCPSEKKIDATLRAYEFNPSDSILALSLGSEYEHAKNYAKALEYYKVYLKVMPKEEEENLPAKYSRRLYFENKIKKLTVLSEEKK
jgi:tetratricopeptide (TPR) repeat protein